MIAEVVLKHKVDTIYNLAALLSVVAEGRPQLAWKIGIDGLWNVLEVAREHECAVFTPSSIGSFGPETPPDNVPQDTIQRPRTIYGVSKVTTELLSDYYYRKYGVDTRAVRFPGLISYVTLPGGGTTDYACDIYYSAVRGEKFVCPIAKGTYMDMMYMPDALRASIELMEADPTRLIHRNAFNIASMSFDPEGVLAAIRKYKPNVEMEYQVFRPVLLQLFHGKSLEEFLLAREIRVQGRDEQALAEPSGAAQEIITSFVNQAVYQRRLVNVNITVVA